MIEAEINKFSGKKGFKYLKNSKEMFLLLEKYGNQEFAIENAQKLELLYSDRSYSNHNPCTKVHRLILELQELKNKHL
ncbi:MAG: hypothetical protein A2X18_11550 [Bacteroidetes bacterium GWF2_40_14]|nr:MAG: hypothetical protein A2X18_11550 [Bacteroidetes bacterium GWF2_40_14]